MTGLVYILVTVCRPLKLELLVIEASTHSRSFAHRKITSVCNCISASANTAAWPIGREPVPYSARSLESGGKRAASDLIARNIMGAAESSEANGQEQQEGSYPSALVIVGPSGVGKGTLISKLMERSDSFGFSCSHTTRAAREGEKVRASHSRLQV